MKLLTDQNMRTIDAITASSEAAGFAATNLLQYDPDLIWAAASFAADVTIVIDLAVASSIKQIWLNNANFVSATIQANATNSWGAPSVSTTVTLAADDVGIYKGFFALSETNYRYVRLVIPVQTLLFGDTLPWLGNIIIGDVETLIVGSWEPLVQENFEAWEPDGGAYSEESTSKQRHIFTASMLGVTKAEIDAAPLKGWQMAVLYTELGSVADSFLVHSPKGKRLRVRSQIDCDLEFVLRERT
ncbi:MAG TPA: hypothetical protein DCG57_01605 [Candidatus Riflebacteria bacterium]|jgi:hypothetical protein|nr:hypothetical protein [Candidatus Riflebacteria bacterium]